MWLNLVQINANKSDDVHNMANTDYITPEVANTLPGLLQQRFLRSAHAIAYGYHDDEHGWCDLSWQHVADQIAKIQHAIKQEQLKKR